MSAAGQLPDGMKKLVCGIRLPVDGLASTGDDHGGTVLGHARFDFDGGGQMHQGGHSAEDALAVVNKADQLAEVGLAAKVDHAFEARMVMAAFAHLNELDSAAEMIDHFLVARCLPPLDRHVELAAGHDNPEGCVLACQFAHLRKP